MSQLQLITASFMLPMTHGCPIMPESGIAVKNGRILAVGSKDELLKTYPNAEHTHLAEQVLMPGLINAHTHLENTAFAQKYFTNPQSSQDFVTTLIAELEYGRKLTPEQAIQSIQESCKVHVNSGTTCVASFTRFDGAFKIMEEMGLRSQLLPEIVAGRPESAQESFEVGLALAEKYIDKKSRRVSVGLAPSAPYLLSRNLLNIICQHARDAHVPLHIHCSESFAEMEFFFDAGGPMLQLFQALGWKELPPKHMKTPVQYLAELGFFNAPVTLVGGVQLSGRDFSLLTRHMVKVVYCPSSNARFQHGSLPLGKLIEAGIPVGLGTETGFGPNAHLWTEMKLCLQGGSQPIPEAAYVLHLATMGGARALGLEKLIGSLEVDKAADCIGVHAPNFSAQSESLRELVLTTTPQHVRYVRVDDTVLKAE